MFNPYGFPPGFPSPYAYQQPPVVSPQTVAFNPALQQREVELQQCESELQERALQLQQQERTLAEREAAVEQREQSFGRKELEMQMQMLSDKAQQESEKLQQLLHEQALSKRQRELSGQEAELQRQKAEHETEMLAREEAIAERERQISRQEERASKTKREAAELKRKAKEEEQAANVKAQRVEEERMLVKALQGQDFAMPSYWTEQDVSNLKTNEMQPSGWAKHKFIIPLIKETIMAGHGPGCNHPHNPLQPLATPRAAAGPPERIYVTSVHRLENVHLWRTYCRARATIVERSLHCSSAGGTSLLEPEPVTMRSLRKLGILDKFGLDSAANECFLWHGTHPDHVESIRSAGFDERLADDGGLYGKGVYFAESKRYTRSSPHPRPFVTLTSCGRLDRRARRLVQVDPVL